MFENCGLYKFYFKIIIKKNYELPTLKVEYSLIVRSNTGSTFRMLFIQ